jgi:hypothetical protein
LNFWWYRSRNRPLRTASAPVVAASCTPVHCAARCFEFFGFRAAAIAWGRWQPSIVIIPN